MFGTKAARRSRTSKQVQNWVDGGMGFVRDGAKHPATWGAALWVALAALVGYSKYRNRDDGAANKRTTRTAAAKTAPAHTRRARSRAKPALAALRAKRKSRTAAKAAELDE
jgi:hypothetical protein